MGFRCKGTDSNFYNVKWLYLKKAYVPAISVCNQRMYRQADLIVTPSGIPDVTDFAMDSNGLFVEFGWTGSDTYQTVIEYRIDAGDWTTLATIDADVDSYYYYFEETSVGHVIDARARFKDDEDNTSTNWVSDTVTLSDYILFEGTSAPDIDEFRSGVSYLYEGEGLTLDGNNVIVSDPLAVSGISVSNKSLQGALRLDGMSNLTYLESWNNDLTSISAIGCTSLSYIDSGDNSTLSSLDFQDCTILDGLYIYSCNFTTINLQGLSALSYVSLQDNPITVLLAGGMTGDGGKAYIDANGCSLSNTAINQFFNSLGTAVDSDKSYINVSDNPGSSTCNPTLASNKGWIVSGGPTQLFNATSGTTSLTPFNSGYTATEGGVTFQLYGNNVFIDSPDNLVSLDLTGSSIHGTLDLTGYNSLESLDISNLTGISSLECGGCGPLSTLLVAGSGIESLVCYSNSITSLSLMGCSSLETINCSSNPLASVDFNSVPLVAITATNLSLNSTVDLSGMHTLTNVTLSGSQVTGLDLTGCDSLQSLTLQTNPLTALDLSPCTSLLEVNAYGCSSLSDVTLVNSLHTVGFDVCPSLLSLDFEPVRTAASAISLGSSAFTSLDFSDYTNLANLSIAQSDSLTTLDVSGCTSLNYLSAQQCALTSVDVSGTSADNWFAIYIHYNNLSSTAINNVFTALPTVTSDKYIYVSHNPGANTCDPTIATNKGWTVYTS